MSFTFIALAEEAVAQPQNHFTFIMMAGVFLLFYVLMIRPMKKEQAEKDSMLGGLKKNDRVVTSSGIYGTVVSIDGNEVTLRVDDANKVKIRFVKAAIARVLNPDGTPATPPADEAKKS